MFYDEIIAQSSILTPNMVDTNAGSIDFGFIDFTPKIQGSIHHLLSCSRQESSFTLDNYSAWWSSDIEMIQNWASDEALVVTQNQAFFSAYRFAIVNPRLQKAVAISLLREPLPVENQTFFKNFLGIGIWRM